VGFHEGDTELEPRPGTVLSGRYELLEKLGEGGMGIVWKALDRNLKETVAVKVLKPALGPDKVDLLKDEARIVHRLSHPNIVLLRDFGEDGPFKFITMEYVDGPSLKGVLDKRGHLPLGEVLDLARGMCADLDYAHSRGIIHRDVTPGNFLVGPDGTVKITDFGLARVAETPGAKVPQYNRAGKVHFMSPEQLMGREVDWRTDIYGLGATFYALLNGRPPFADGNALDRVMHEQVPDIPNVPGHVNTALRKAMAKTPEDRWQTAADLLRALMGPPAPSRRGRVPVKLTTFFGREKELEQLEELLLREGQRLVTLAGLAGCGKTRLAIEAARRMTSAFGGRVWFVSVQDVGEPGLILGAVLDALGEPRQDGVHPVEQLAGVLPTERSLLVLDNFEHLVEGGGQVVRGLLERVPALTCLVTSRRALDLKGEREFTVRPLPTPSGEETEAKLMQCPSAELFVDRARAVRPDFKVTEQNAESVANVCRRLEGIPLALELAAARARVMTPAGMLIQLKRPLDFLVDTRRGATSRHRTMREALEWSYKLLQPGLQRFFASLSVFRGGWTVEAAEAVCEEPRALDYIEELRECSLVLAEECRWSRTGMRFLMLESVREYADEQLSAEEREARRRLHAQFYLSLVERSKPDDEREDVWLERLASEQDNIGAARAWYRDAPDGGGPQGRLTGVLDGLRTLRRREDNGARADRTADTTTGN
jgi:non-specific serine/threonine protein kinase